MDHSSATCTNVPFPYTPADKPLSPGQVQLTSPAAVLGNETRDLSALRAATRYGYDSGRNAAVV
jgi:hypothetical protein